MKAHSLYTTSNSAWDFSNPWTFCSCLSRLSFRLYNFPHCLQTKVCFAVAHFDEELWRLKLVTVVKRSPQRLHRKREIVSLRWRLRGRMDRVVKSCVGAELEALLMSATLAGTPRLWIWAAYRRPILEWLICLGIGWCRTLISRCRASSRAHMNIGRFRRTLGYEKGNKTLWGCVM